MNGVQLRGGVPFVIREGITTAGRQVRLPTETFWLKLRNKGSNIIRLYFRLQDFTLDANYVEIPIAAATAPHGEWEGPVEVPPYAVEQAGALIVEQSIWLKAQTGTTDIEVVAFQRRG